MRRRAIEFNRMGMASAVRTECRSRSWRAIGCVRVLPLIALESFWRYHCLERRRTAFNVRLPEAAAGAEGCLWQ